MSGSSQNSQVLKVFMFFVGLKVILQGSQMPAQNDFTI